MTASVLLGPQERDDRGYTTMDLRGRLQPELGEDLRLQTRVDQLLLDVRAVTSALTMAELTAAEPDALRRLARSLRDLFRRHPAAAPLILRCSSLPRSELELFRVYLDTLMAGGIAEPAAVLRPLVAYALGSGYTESAMLSVRCAPEARFALTEREVLLALGQALPPGTPPELASAAVALIADCNPERCFEDGLALMLTGLKSQIE